MAAIGDAYATHPDYTLRFSNAVDAKRKPAIDRALLDATRWITSRCHQFFTKNGSLVDRIFVSNGAACLCDTCNGGAYAGSALKVYGGDNCPGIASSVGVIVKLDSNSDGAYSTTLDTLNWELHPLNALIGDEPGPFKHLVLPYWTTASYRSWPQGMRIKVTAKFGWPSVPAPIRDGCVELAGILLGDSPLASRQFTDIGTVGASTEARNIVRDMIDIYRETVFA